MQTPNFEIPTEMRDFAEKSVDQARNAVGTLMGNASRPPSRPRPRARPSSRPAAPRSPRASTTPRPTPTRPSISRRSSCAPRTCARRSSCSPSSSAASSPRSRPRPRTSAPSPERRPLRPVRATPDRQVRGRAPGSGRTSCAGRIPTVRRTERHRSGRPTGSSGPAAPTVRPPPPSGWATAGRRTSRRWASRVDRGGPRSAWEPKSARRHRYAPGDGEGGGDRPQPAEADAPRRRPDRSPNRRPERRPRCRPRSRARGLPATLEQALARVTEDTDTPEPDHEAAAEAAPAAEPEPRIPEPARRAARPRGRGRSGRARTCCRAAANGNVLAEPTGGLAIAARALRRRRDRLDESPATCAARARPPWRTCNALSGARSPADVIRLQVGETQRAADASLTCWGSTRDRTRRSAGASSRLPVGA